MIILDASALIAYMHAQDAHHASVSAFLGQNADETFAASAISVAEALVRPAHTDVVADAQKAFDLLDLEVVPFDAEDSLGLAETRVRTRLAIPDAIVVHTARRHHAAILTTDKKLAAASTADGVFGHVPDD